MEYSLFMLRLSENADSRYRLCLALKKGSVQYIRSVWDMGVCQNEPNLDSWNRTLCFERVDL